MGSSISWMAVRGADQAAVLEHMGWQDTGASARPYGRGLSIAPLPGGWVLVASGNFDDCLKPARLEALSKLGPVVACQVEDHVMYSRAVGYEGGSLRWSVTRDPEAGDGLGIKGAAPSELDAIVKRRQAEQDADEDDDFPVDFLFEAPADLGMALTGYRHDEGAEPTFTAIGPVRASSGGTGKGKGLFGWLFGR